ncbi:hypothetical protein ACP70R_018368 [Stipagrostis hirtigluma subsp. patula]
MYTTVYELSARIITTIWEMLGFDLRCSFRLLHFRVSESPDGRGTQQTAAAVQLRLDGSRTGLGDGQQIEATRHQETDVRQVRHLKVDASGSAQTYGYGLAWMA